MSFRLTVFFSGQTAAAAAARTSESASGENRMMRDCDVSAGRSLTRFVRAKPPISNLLPAPT